MEREGVRQLSVLRNRSMHQKSKFIGTHLSTISPEYFFKNFNFQIFMIFLSFSNPNPNPNLP